MFYFSVPVLTFFKFLMSSSQFYWRDLRQRQVLARQAREKNFFKHVLCPQASRIDDIDANGFLKKIEESFRRQDWCYQQRAEDIRTPTSPIKASL